MLGKCYCTSSRQIQNANHRCCKLAFGVSVVPLVYMMVHRSSGLGGTGGAGLEAPSLAKSQNANALIPKEVVSCIGGHQKLNHQVLCSSTTSGAPL